MSRRFHIPNSWKLVELGDIAKVEWGNTSITKKSYVASGAVAFSASGPDGFLQNAEWFGDGIVLSAIGAQCGKCFKAHGEWSAIKNTIVIQSLQQSDLNINYLFYFLNDQRRWKLSGSGQPFITLKTARENSIPVPPINEQHRIVAKIEELFSELDQSIANLKTAQSQLKVYRQSLLKHAFEGKLTAEWRAQNADTLESASALQQRIQHAREQRYEQQLAEWQANGKQGSKPKAPKPIAPLTTEELAELPELPEGWGWMKFDQVVNIDSNLVNPNNFGSYPHIAPDNVERGTGRLLSYRTIKEDEVISPKHRFFPGQIIYSKIRPYLSKLVIAQFNGLCSADMYPLSTGLNIKFLFYLMLSKYFVSKASNSGSRTVLPKINQQELGIIALPVCPLKEQTQIVGQLESSLSEIEQLDQTITTSLKQAEALRQSILKKAFSGELVPQDPNDEPAAALLARIQAEKAEHKTKHVSQGQAKMRTKRTNMNLGVIHDRCA